MFECNVSMKLKNEIPIPFQNFMGLREFGVAMRYSVRLELVLRVHFHLKGAVEVLPAIN